MPEWLCRNGYVATPKPEPERAVNIFLFKQFKALARHLKQRDPQEP